jgi:DNA-binding protein HU-beta
VIRAKARWNFSSGGEDVNKGQLIEALESPLGGKKAAANAVEAVLDVIIRTVVKGQKVGITGFGTFERVSRAARIGRNPRTGASVKIKKTAVPKFKAGTKFREVVADPKQLPKTSAAGARASAGTSAASSGRAGVKKAAVKKGAAKKTAAKKAAPAKKSAAKKTTAKKAAPAKKAAVKKASAAKKTAVKKTSVKKAAATLSSARKSTPAKATVKKAASTLGSAKKTTTRKSAAKRS